MNNYSNGLSNKIIQGKHIIKGNNHEGPTKIKQNEYLLLNNPSYAIPCNDIIACFNFVAFVSTL